MTDLDWIDVAAIWLPENKHRLDHLLHDPIENSPAVMHAILGFPLNQFVFWERPSPTRIRGWALTHGTWDSRSWNILRGDEFCFETFLRSSNPAESQAFEYIREEERVLYARFLDVKPIPFAYYYEATRDEFQARSNDLAEVAVNKPYKIHAFDPGRALDWIKFQGYPSEEPAVSAYQRLDGLCMTCDGQIVASVHDGLSMLPCQVQEAAINGIRVAESDRGKGFCTALLHEFLDRLFSSGKQRAGLFVDTLDESAKHCYERVGLVKKQRYYKVELEPAKSSSRVTTRDRKYFS